jgi:hypothetical protein
MEKPNAKTPRREERPDSGNMPIYTLNFSASLRLRVELLAFAVFC